MLQQKKLNLQRLVKLFTDQKKLQEIFGTSEEDEKNMKSILNLKVRSQLKEIMHVRNKFAHGQDTYPAEINRCFQLTKRVFDQLKISLYTRFEESNEIERFNNGLKSLNQNVDDVAFHIAQPSFPQDNVETMRLFSSLPNHIFGREELISCVVSVLTTSAES